MMTGHRLGVLVAGFVVLVCGATVQAQDGVLEEIDRFLKNATNELDNNLLFERFRFTPRISQSVVYDDNIWQNDHHEGINTNDADGNQIRETRGREWDVISDSVIDLSLVLPVNPTYTKLFKKEQIVLLGYEVEFLEYMRRGETDAINQTLYTDIFGFLSELFKVDVGREQGAFVSAEASFKDISNPIDIYERELGPALVGIPDLPPIIRRDSELKWYEITGRIDLGYRANIWDVRGGYQFDWIDFRRDFYSQADQTAHTGRLEVGVSPPTIGGGRIFVRGEYTDLEFDEGLLNDAKIWDVRLGFEGPIPSLFSRKVSFLVEGGLRSWDSQNTGSFTFRRSAGAPLQIRENADKDDFLGFVWLARIVYQPWEDRQSGVQFETSRNIVWSAIANYRSDYRIELTLFHEFIPRKLGADVAASWSRFDPSQGPHRYMFEVGGGVTYHLLEQVDVFVRYLYQIQKGRKELALAYFNPPPAGSPPGTSATIVNLESDSDFFQNIFSLGIEITF